jgi:hypothetical protein
LCLPARLHASIIGCCRQVLRSNIGASADSVLPSRFIRVDAAAGVAVAHCDAGFTVFSLQTGAAVTGSDRYARVMPTSYLQDHFLPVADQSADDTRRCLMLSRLILDPRVQLWEFTRQGPRVLAEWDASPAQQRATKQRGQGDGRPLWPEQLNHTTTVVLLPGVIAGLTADAKDRVCALSLQRVADNVVRQIPVQ